MSDATSSSFPHRPAIALVGNPGAGKSTLLNGLAGSPQFRSGPSLVEGLTEVLQAFQVGKLTLYDTPGLFDVTRTKQAGEELDKLLSQNVALKIAFVVTLDGGRVRRADILTIKLVLNAISVDTNDRFGVIVNKMEESVEAMIREDPETECKLRKILTGDRKTSHWCYVPMETSLLGAKDQRHTTVALHLLLHGLPVTKPLYTEVSSVETQNLEKLLEAAERHVSEIENAKGEEFREMMADYELQKLDADKRINALEQALCEHESKNAQRPKEVQNIEEEKREESVALDLDVPFEAIEQGRKAEDDRDGVLADPVREVARYNRAIENDGDVRAMYNLACLLRYGADGVPADPVRSVELYNRAIEEGGYVDAMYNLALLLQHGADGVSADPVRAVELYNRAIDEGDRMYAMYNLAFLLKDGTDGVPADPVRAVELYNRVIEESGDVDAMVNLALLLQNGADGVSADPVRAVELYNRAIDEGESMYAMYNLALLLKHGANGVPADPVRAAELYNRSMRKV